MVKLLIKNPENSEKVSEDKSDGIIEEIWKLPAEKFSNESLKKSPVDFSVETPGSTLGRFSGSKS